LIGAPDDTPSGERFRRGRVRCSNSVTHDHAMRRSSFFAAEDEVRIVEMLLRLHVGRLDDGVPCVVVVGSEDDVAAGAALLQGRMNRALAVAYMTAAVTIAETTAPRLLRTRIFMSSPLFYVAVGPIRRARIPEYGTNRPNEIEKRPHPNSYFCTVGAPDAGRRCVKRARESPPPASGFFHPRLRRGC